MSPVVFVVRGGPVTQAQVDDDVYPAEALGATEWQFSDGPPGRRGFSRDYSTLEEGLEAHAGQLLNWSYSELVHGGVPDCPHVWIDWVGGDVLIPVCQECGGVRALGLPPGYLPEQVEVYPG